jgi:hypothetical protein
MEMRIAFYLQALLKADLLQAGPPWLFRCAMAA